MMAVVNIVELIHSLSRQRTLASKIFWKDGFFSLYHIGSQQNGIPKFRCVFLNLLSEHVHSNSTNNYTSKTNSSHLKIGLPKRTLVFQLSIFRDYVSFREGALFIDDLFWALINHKASAVFFVCPCNSPQAESGDSGWDDSVRQASLYQKKE